MTKKHKIKTKTVSLPSTDQIVWQALKAMKKRGVSLDSQPSLAEIDKAVVELGFHSMGTKIISKSLRRLELKGWIRRPLQLVA
jgi:hypothetical protein